MIMTEEKKIPVFEGKDEKEAENLQRALEDVGIETDLEDSPMAFPYPKDQNSFKLKVDLLDEKKAFEIIDKHLQA